MQSFMNADGKQRTQGSGIIHWDECLFWIKSSGRPLMDRHNAPAVLSLSKGGTTFFIKMSLIKLMKAWLPQESTCWRIHAFGGKMLHGGDLSILTTTHLSGVV